MKQTKGILGSLRNFLIEKREKIKKNKNVQKKAVQEQDNIALSVKGHAIND
jgi:hypothetical protein